MRALSVPKWHDPCVNYDVYRISLWGAPRTEQNRQDVNAAKGIDAQLVPGIDPLVLSDYAHNGITVSNEGRKQLPRRS
jgi:hypothetical protein